MRRIVAALIIGTAVLAAAPASAKAPRPCLKALQHAESIVDTNVDVSVALGAFFDDVQAAAQEGALTGDVASFLDAQTVALNTLTDKINQATAEVGPKVDAYKAAAKACRRS